MISVALFVIAQILLLINIQLPKTVNFDEVQYVPSAKAFLDFKEYRNPEHPPLAKELISIGIAAAGDNQLGWRLMSTIFGALTLVGTFFWALALFKNEQMALFATGFTLFNQLLYVQARIAMLDTFLVAFLIWALALFTFSLDKNNDRKFTIQLWLASGCLFGFALACKWSAIFALAPTWLLILILRQKRFAFWQKVELKWVALTMIAAPALCYFLTFIPLTFFKTNGINILNFFSFQREMYNAQLRVVGSHPYISHWPSWPVMTRPIWYAFDKDIVTPPLGSGASTIEYIRGVILLGNPLVMWVGLVATISCAYCAVVKKMFVDFILVYYYAAMYGCWVFFPRTVEFYYYYYPAAMVLGLALTQTLFTAPLNKIPSLKYWLLAASAVLFFYFLPILGAFRIGPGEFTKWMWLRSWI